MAGFADALQFRIEWAHFRFRKSGRWVQIKGASVSGALVDMTAVIGCATSQTVLMTIRQWHFTSR